MNEDRVKSIMRGMVNEISDNLGSFSENTRVSLLGDCYVIVRLLAEGNADRRRGKSETIKKIAGIGGYL